MRTKSSVKIIYAFAFTFLVISCQAGLSQDASGTKLNNTSVNMKYDYPTDKYVKYLVRSSINQIMDINGQSVQTNVTEVLGCRIKSTGPLESGIGLEIVIDTMAQNIESPMGNSGGSIPAVAGKIFGMILSHEGRESFLPGAEIIKYDAPSGGSGDASESFNDFFPDIPSGSVKPGYTWSTTDTIDNVTSTNRMKQIIKYEHIFDGFEKYGEINCARISSVLTGTMEVKTSTQGMDLIISGPLQGTSITLFAPSGGYFTQQSASSKVSGTIEITSPENMTFPIVMEVKSIKEIVY